MTIGLLLIAVFAFARNFFNAASEAFGAEWAKRVVARRGAAGDQRRARRGVRRRVRKALAAGGDPITALAATADNVDAVARTLRDSVAPTPAVAALLAALGEGPLAGKRLVVIGLGRDVERHVQAAELSTGSQQLLRTQIVAAHPEQFWGSLRASLDSAQASVVSEEASAIALILRPPLLGSWAAEASLDIDHLAREIFGQDDIATWLVVDAPADAATWPEQVLVQTKFPIRTLRKIWGTSDLNRRGQVKRLSKRSARLTATAAADLLISLTGGATSVNTDPSAPPSPVAVYAARLTLALAPATAEGRGHVSEDDSAVVAASTFLTAVGIEFISRPETGMDVALSLTALQSRLIAWRTNPVPSELATGSAEPPTDSAIGWLRQAIESHDLAVVEAILSSHGRAWIESPPIEPTLDLLTETCAKFPAETDAALWAHYLLALDSALRQNRPTSDWFDDAHRQLAKGKPLEHLFLAEHMEFSRLRGDLAHATDVMNSLIATLADASSPTGHAAAYALGTAHMLVGNVLRRGGRYADAREFIRRATSTLGDSTPATRIELTHCTYGLAVCDGMRGAATVRADDEWPRDQAVFARSLVTLSNSHAAWVVGDFARAVDFARRAQQGFDSIGYTRYANRAHSLEVLLRDWARHSQHAVDGSPGNADPTVELLLTAQPGAHVNALNDARPSRALSLVQFAVRFAPNPHADMVIELPTHIALVDGTYSVRATPPATSFADADFILRQLLEVPANVQVPLAVD